MTRFLYFANPMCSWCWGFSPCIEYLKQDYKDNDIRLVLTPFRIDITEPMDEKLRNYVLGQWKKVHATTSQAFDFAFNVSDGFIYNTTLTMKAIKAFKKLLPEKELEFLKILQWNFYVHNRDITDEKIVIELVENFAIPTGEFAEIWHSQDCVDELNDDFNLCSELNVQSYPTLMCQHDHQYQMLSTGFVPYAEIKQKIATLPILAS